VFHVTQAAESDINLAVADAVKASLATPAAEKAPPPEVPAPEVEPVTPEPPVATDLEEVPEGDDAPEAPDGEDDGEGRGEGESKKAELPEGFVATKSITDKLATEFTIRDGDGEIEVPDVIIEYKANGKVRKDRLDQVVKLAQWGVYNQDKMAEAEQSVAAERTEREQLAQALEQREAQLERLLQDDDYLAAVREAYERENSPERRAARAEEEVQSVRVNAEMERITTQGQQFYRDEVAPALQMIQEALPTVEVGEMEERIAYAMALHAAQAPNGQRYLPPSQFPKLRDYLVKDLVFWAQMQHAMRTEGQPDTQRPQAKSPAAPVAKAVDPEVTRAQAAAQKAKQQLAKAARPMGRGTDGKFVDKARAKPINTVDDATEAAVAAVMASIPQ
jgi:hypothetical protein